VFQVSHTNLLTQAKKHWSGNAFTPRVLDIGCGDARFLQLCRAHFPKASLFGMDISSAMLAQGRQRVDFLPLHLEIKEGLELLVKSEIKFDFIVLSYISAYLDLKDILPKVKSLLTTRGIVLYQSGLANNFPNLLDIVVREYGSSRNPLKNRVFFHAQAARDKLHNFVDEGSMMKAFETQKMKVLSSGVLRIPLCNYTLNDYITFMLKGSWLSVNIGARERFILNILARLKVLSYPKQDDFVLGYCIGGVETAD